MIPELTFLTEERGAWARDELARPGPGRHVCGADILRARTSGSDRLWSFEEDMAGPWVYHEAQERMYRLPDVFGPTYRLHRCDGVEAVEPAA